MKKQDAAVILGVDQAASPVSVKAAYRGLAKKFHPDLYPHVSPAKKQELQRRFAQISQAYRVLSGLESETVDRVVVASASGAAEIRAVDQYFNAAQRVGTSLGIGIKAVASGHLDLAAKAGSVLVEEAGKMKEAVDQVAAGPVGHFFRGLKEVIKPKK